LNIEQISGSFNHDSRNPLWPEQPSVAPSISRT